MNLDWFTKFSNKHKDYEWSVLSYICRLLRTHKDINGVSKNVGMLSSFLTNLQTSGVLNNTVVLLGGDHGNHRVEDYFKTEIGAYEARMPLQYAIFPKWFQTKHRKAYENLKFNGKKD